jgi:hypothetical protein
MNTHRKTAIIVGVLFIIATVAGILSLSAEAIIDAPDYLINVSANGNQIIIGALLILIMGVAIAPIPVMLFPILKKHNEALALGYVVFRLLEVVTDFVVMLSWLLLLTLSQEYVKAVAPDVSYFQTFGTLLLATGNWNSVIMTIVFSLSVLILNYILYKSKLIPRWLSGWGLIGGTLFLASGFLPLFGHGARSMIYILLNVPGGVYEMVFAVWLIAKGFNSSAIASLSAQQN